MENRDHLLQYTIPQLLRWRVGQTGDKTALREKDFGYWNNYSWSLFYERVGQVALGLEALGLNLDDWSHLLVRDRCLLDDALLLERDALDPTEPDVFAAFGHVVHAAA